MACKTLYAHKTSSKHINKSGGGASPNEPSMSANLVVASLEGASYRGCLDQFARITQRDGAGMQSSDEHLSAHNPIQNFRVTENISLLRFDSLKGGNGVSLAEPLIPIGES
ncbi:hypothetical protein V6N13_036755 [Hibiscus sabdariffa]|uniref:Uncharacterized protein n=1 Tax=Hibiscus sabdariffa TaxID=183260 RepID=A0ABR2S5G0_9ROSI